MPACTFDILTIFPDFFDGPLSHGMVYQARKRGILETQVHDLRDYTTDRHRTVDDRPFGGGEGMVLKPEPIFRCVRQLQEERQGIESRVVLLTPQGKRFDQAMAYRLAACQRLILICGRYEGVDERVAEHLADDEISIGDYILSGGELAACVLVETICRLFPGVLGNESSTRNESFSMGANSAVGGATQNVLDCPHYTRPEDFEGLKVPEVLLSGDHKKVGEWRRCRALEKTLKNRPDLLEYGVLSEQDQRLLNSD